MSYILLQGTIGKLLPTAFNYFLQNLRLMQEGKKKQNKPWDLKIPLTE